MNHPKPNQDKAPKPANSTQRRHRDEDQTEATENKDRFPANDVPDDAVKPDANQPESPVL